MNRPPLLRHVPRWLVEVLVTAAAFFLAYRPLQGRPEALSLALTAMAAVGYTALTFELMLLGRRQVLTLTEQVATQHEELEQNKAALERQREEATRQAEHAEEARDAARAHVAGERVRPVRRVSTAGLGIGAGWAASPAPRRHERQDHSHLARLR